MRIACFLLLVAVPLAGLAACERTIAERDDTHRTMGGTQTERTTVTKDLNGDVHTEHESHYNADNP